MKNHKSTSRLLAWLLISLMLLLTMPPAQGITAADGYTYTPPSSLYANGKPIMFLDYNMTGFGAMTGADARSRLNTLKMNLNGFGVRTAGTYVNAASPFNGSISPTDSTAEGRDFSAVYDFSSLLNEQGGSIRRMLAKGDIRLATAFSVYTRQYDRKYPYLDKSTRANIGFLGQSWYFNGEEMPNLWNKVNYGGKNSETDGPLALPLDPGWVAPTKNNLQLTYKSYSLNEGPVDSKMRVGVVVGKDVKGPSILAVDVYEPTNSELPPANSHPYSATSGYYDLTGTWGNVNDNYKYKKITKADIGKTIYFSVMFDEPVKFRDDWATPENLSNLTLIVQTMGRASASGSSTATPTAAKFLSYAPGTTDSCPVMIFSYQIQNPTDSHAFRKDDYYTFDSVIVSSADNPSIYNQITDLAGNSFSALNGSQQQKLVSSFNVRNSGYPTVDLLELAVESIELTRSGEVKKSHLRAGDTVTVAVNLNKKLSQDTLDTIGAEAGSNRLPTISLNFGQGQDLQPTRAATGKNSDNGVERTTLYYENIPVNAGDETPAGEHIKITEIDIPEECVDDAGYKLSANVNTFQYKKQYFVDTVAPTLGVTVADQGGDIYKVEASLTDTSQVLDASFFIKVNLEGPGAVQYQAGANGLYNAGDWLAAAGNTISLSAPASSNKATVFLKLPTGDIFVDGISVDVSAMDAAGNTGQGSYDLALGIDRVKPSVTLTKTKTVDEGTGETIAGDGAVVSGSDKNLATTFDYAVVPGTNTTNAPSSWTSKNWETNGSYDGASGSATFSHGLDMSESDLYEYVLWVKVADAGGLTATAAVACSYDNRYAEMWVYSVSSDSDEIVWLKDAAAAAAEGLPSALPSVSVRLGANVQQLTYQWTAPGYSAGGTMTAADFEPGVGIELTMPAGDNLSHITGPTKLTLTATAATGDPRVETVTFNTLYEASGLVVFKQTAFSSTDAYGRPDERRGDGFIPPVRENPYAKKALNATALADIGDAEFSLESAVTGADYFTMLDWANTELTLRKVEFTSGTGVIETASTEEGVVFEDEGLVSSDDIYAWKFEKTDFFKANGASNPYTFSARIKLKDAEFEDLTPVAYTIDENGDVTLTRYEFWLNAAYVGTGDTSQTLLGVFAFHNTPPDESTYQVISRAIGLSEEPEEAQAAYSASLAYEGGQIVDNSIVVPQITRTTRAYGTGAIDDSFVLESTFTARLPAAARKMLLGGYANNYSAEGRGYRVQVGGWENLEFDATTGLFTVKYLADRWKQLYPDSSGSLITGDVKVDKTADRVQRVYYQIADSHRSDWINSPATTQNKDIYSPVYCVDIVWDTEFPTVSFTASGADSVPDGPDGDAVTVGAASLGPVMVGFSAADGHMEGQDGDEYVMDTPSELIVTEVLSSDYDNSASDEDGNSAAQLDPETGLYVFKRNGALQVQATDAAGNKKTSTFTVTTIDRSGPDVTFDGTASSFIQNNGKFTMAVDITGDAVSADLLFDRYYMQYLTGISLDDLPTSLYDADYPGYEVGDAASGMMGALPGVLDSMITRDQNGYITRISLTLYADPDAWTGYKGIQFMMVRATDALGNTGHHNGMIGPWPTQDGALKGEKAQITNQDKTYAFGGTLDFNVPVKLEMVTEDGAKAVGAGYATSFANLPVYANGPAAVRYRDLFGNVFDDVVTADMGDDYAHALTIEPAGKTQGPVTVTVDTNGFACQVTGGTNGVWTQAVSANGDISYEITAQNGTPKTFTIPVTNIDDEPPEATYDRLVNGRETSADAGEPIFTVTYTILGFSEQGVTMAEGEANTFTFTFTAPGTHTFHFTDAAGNAGTLTVDESSTIFESPQDKTITHYRLTYTLGLNSSPVRVDADVDTPDDFDDFPAGSTAELLVNPPTNQNIMVQVEALNAAGDVLPATMSFAAVEGVKYVASQNTLIFTKEAAAPITLTAGGNSVGATVVVPAGAIDQTPPTGKVEYLQLAEGDPVGGFVRGGVKAYLRPDNPAEIAPDSIVFSDLTANMQTDEVGTFVYFAANGSGVFHMSDKAGNIGSVAVFMYEIDLDAPQLSEESWFGTNGLTADEVLGNITNNSIRLFLRFDKTIAKADVAAYEAEYVEGSSTPVPIPADYVKYTIAANTMTVEFKQNCQARITVYDAKGNTYTILRPEDGPVAVIDREAPTIITKNINKVGNAVRVDYIFNEDVTSATAQSEFDLAHTIEFAKNGAYSLTFVDRAGNPVADIVEITQIDTLSPTLNYTLTVDGDGGTQALYADDAQTKIIATNGNVKITLAATDTGGGTVTLAVANLNRPAIPLPIENNVVTVRENGVYTITAKDDWGNTTRAQARIDFIDRLAPILTLAGTKAVNVAAHDDPADLSAALLADATARDEREGDLTAAITVAIDSVDLNTPGSYQATYAVADALGNRAERTRTVRVNGGDPLKINNEPVWADDIYNTTATSLSVTAPAGYSLYWAAGSKTYGQMKYAAPLSGALNTTTKGFYTILAQGADRDAYLVYVYAY
ncbi:MAG: DUF5011 domain-containing protein [Gracilibacteraceae bacterium]|jgi:hypothetical protein|nr:DUF5011 domain-containing protein [Gracilibacteraceae bacterium]